jgi:predicted dehydrogenase
MKRDKIRLGVVGAGAVVREIYQYLYFQSEYSPILQVAAVAEPNAQCRDWFGELAGLPKERRFENSVEMLRKADLDAVQINTPDHLHCTPAVEALRAGLDVVIPKPTASTIKDAHEMIRAAKQAGRFLGVYFHKREDPRIKEAAARYRKGRYGQLQAAVIYMLDKLLVADPNHVPRFFASQDFAEKNTPISFLTVHMADALMHIVGLVPTQVRATGYRHKLQSLKPRSVQGYDLVDTEVVFNSGAIAHILTGWALPNTAWATTVQSGRLICSDGLLDLGLDTPGLCEIHTDGVAQVNPLFRNFESNHRVTGYGISSPGRLYETILARRRGELTPQELQSALTPMTVGFFASLVLEGAQKSLSEGERMGDAAIRGKSIDLRTLVVETLGKAAATEYHLC